MQTHSKYFFKSDEEIYLSDKSDMILITDNFSTPENIGNIIRLAANLGTNKVIVAGSKDCRQSKIKKTAGAAMGHVTVSYCDYDNLMQLIPANYKLIALETVEGAESIYETGMPERMALVLGNEKYGISHELLSKCEHAVYIPMNGPVKSMNVSHAASVCSFEWLRQRVVNEAESSR